MSPERRKSRSAESGTKKTRIAAAVCFLCAGALFVIVGIARGEPAVVEMKAVQICLECIGIG